MGAPLSHVPCCGNCGRIFSLHEHEARPGGALRRPVPARGGRKLLVCADCASAIDKQGTFDLEPAGAP